MSGWDTKIIAKTTNLYNWLGDPLVIGTIVSPINIDIDNELKT